MSCRTFSLRLAALIIAVAPSVTGVAQIRFTEVGEARGIGPFSMAAGRIGGVAVADFDNDGDSDIFAPNGEGFRDQLYENLGNGEFVDIAVSAGVGSGSNHRSALWLDYDGDGKLDLLVAGDCVDEVCGRSSVTLYRQSAPRVFENVTLQSRLVLFTDSGSATRAGIAAGDVNNDGYLDLCIATWADYLYLFINSGDGTFRDRSAASGIGLQLNRYYQPVMADFNGDGWLDIFVAIDAARNELWLNRRNGSFVDIAPDVGLSNTMNDMGVALGDYDNDGDFDIYVTNITFEDRHNVLFRNDTVGGRPAFEQVAHEVGVAEGYWDWGVTFLDCDNDGWLDIATTNSVTDKRREDPSRLFHNLGSSPSSPIGFVDKSTEFGFDDVEFGTALVSFDYDRDGDLDLLQACAYGGALRLLENNPDDDSPGRRNNYLVVQPRMPGPNHRAIGAVVRARSGDLEMTRIISAGTSMIGQEPAEAFFGTGPNEVVEELTVEWPDGTQTVLHDIAANQLLTITPAANASFIRGDVDENGALEITDVIRILSYSFASEAVTCLDSYDVDDDGRLATADAVHLLFYLFLGGPSPEIPWPDCGSDRTSDEGADLGCAEPPRACR